MLCGSGKGRDELNTFWRATLLSLCPVVVALPLAASEPLYVKNLSPVTGLLGLPSQRSADSEATGELADCAAQQRGQ